MPDSTTRPRPSPRPKKFPSKDDGEQQLILAIAADVQQSAGNYETARELLKAGFRKYPKNSRIAVGLACQYIFDGRTDLAILTFREARTANPQDADILTLLADQLAHDGQVAPLEDALCELTAMNAPADRIHTFKPDC